MADSLRVPNSRKEVKGIIQSQPKKCLVASIPKQFSMKALQRLSNVDQSIFSKGTITKVGLFVLKVAVLEAVRRFSTMHCPFLWRSLQALQFICLPPLKWIQKWGFFRGLIKCMQSLSRPLLFLSVATSIPNGSSNVEETLGRSDDSQPRSESQADTVPNRASNSSEVTESSAQERWMLELFAELEKEGISLPERITEDDLRRFYHVTNGDFSSFASSVKRTINWRQNFRFLSVQELEDRSEMVFWHGFDVKRHPCLIIRVQAACSNIVAEERSRLPEVVVSQIEYGTLHLVNAEDPLVTVLMDCEGLSPFGFPIPLMRSCAILLQDHYPNRLAALFVVRLPPIARIIAQTLNQVLRPGTRRKLRILGEDYRSVLSEYLEELPSFLGGYCSCSICAKFIGGENNVVRASIAYEPENVPSRDPSLRTDVTDQFDYAKCDRLVTSIVIGLLVMLLLCIVYTFGFSILEGIQLYRGGL